MFKFVVPCCGLNFQKHVIIRSKLEIWRKCHQSVIFLTSQNSSSSISSIKLLPDCRKASNDSHFRKFFEYQDVNDDKSEFEPISHPIFEGAENRNLHTIMEKDKRYSSTIANISINDKIDENEFHLIINKNWRNETISQLVDNFRKLSHHGNENERNIHSEDYDGILNSLTKNVHFLTDDQILKVLQSLSLWFVQTNDNDSNYSKLYTAIDIECAKRSDFWRVEMLLLVTDHWYRLRLIKRSHFVQKILIRLSKDPEKLLPPNLVQFLFYACVSRSTLVNFKKVEYALREHVKSLNIDELAIVSLAFFKNQTQIRDREILALIINKTVDKIDSISDFSLAGIFKIVRYSIHLNDLDFLCKLLENTIPQIPRLSVACLVHVILAAANRSLFYAELLNAVTAKFQREISKVRLKDIRCLVFALSSFNYMPKIQPNIFTNIIRELGESNRRNEVERFPECFASCVHHLSVLNIRPKKLIAKVLHPKTIQRAYGSNVELIRRELFALDSNIEAEIPDYRGPRLDARMRDNVAMRVTDAGQWPKKSQLTAADYFMIDVIKSCEQLLGSKDLVHVDYVLPQYHRPDIIVCLDESNSPIPISSLISKLPFGRVKHPPKMNSESIKWLALIIGGSNSYARNTYRLSGQMCAKQRQLRFIGYTPYLIFWQDWKQLKNDEEKLKYLQWRVFG